MHKIVQDELFESMIRAAVIEIGLEEMEAYPLEKELSALDLSIECNARIRRMMRCYDHTVKIGRILAGIKYMTAKAAIAAGVIFCIFLNSNEVRGACYDVIVRVYERFIEFRHENHIAYDSSVTGVPGYLPEGYVEVSNNNVGDIINIRYETYMGEQINIVIMNNSDYIYQMDKKYYDITDLKIKEYDGKYFKNKKNEADSIIWYEHEHVIRIAAVLKKEELIKIAENYKIICSI